MVEHCGPGALAMRDGNGHARLGSTRFRWSGQAALRIGEFPRTRSPFRCGSPSAIPAGADSGANLATRLGKEEEIQAVQAEEVSRQSGCQRAARTPHSPVVVSGWNCFLDTANAADSSGNGQCERHIRHGWSHPALACALVDRVDDRRGSAASHLVAG
jgi:hypothetical protein